MYYTGKGDKGTSKLFEGKERLLKSDSIFEVLGTLDELNSFLGICSFEAKANSDIYQQIIQEQNNLFICQAHFAEAKIKIPEDLVSNLELRIQKIAKNIKERKNFVLPGGSRLSASLDFSRTLARKTERRALSLPLENRVNYNELVYVYLNRLSSFLYVLARYANDLSEIDELAPKY